MFVVSIRSDTPAKFKCLINDAVPVSKLPQLVYETKKVSQDASHTLVFIHHSSL